MEKDNLNNIEDKPSPRRKRKWLFLVISAPIIALVLVFGLVAYAAQDYSLPFVKYQGQDVGLKTFPEVTKLVMQSDKQFKKQGLSVNFEGKTESKTYDELGISLQTSKTADSIFNYGKKSMFVSLPTLSYFRNVLSGKAEARIDVKRSSDTEKKLSELFENTKKDAINPSIEVEDETFKITKEAEGYKIDVNDFESQVENKLNSNGTSVVVLKKIPTKANFNSTDVESFRKDIENMLGKNIYVQSDYKKQLMKKSDIVKFIDLEMTILNQKLTLSDKPIDDYLNSLSKYFNVKGRSKKVSSLDNSIIDEGAEGKKIDIEKSRKNIREALENDKKVAVLEITTAPIEEEVISPGYNPGKYPGKFIEVNLSQQMLYTFEGSQLIGSFRVSTGKWSMPTPEGEYSINDKVARAYSSRYDLYMPYWMAFIGSEYGIHELPEWANGTKEGEAHLGTPVSHGCVRLGRGSAQEVYDWAEVGTAVFIHR